jgi:predicted metalloprotease
VLHASGPFIVPDQKIYGSFFFNELKTRFGAQGDFATAYVIAHEIGHHVQTLLGTSAKMRQMQEGKSQAEANKLSVALELQADFMLEFGRIQPKNEQFLGGRRY